MPKQKGIRKNVTRDKDSDNLNLGFIRHLHVLVAGLTATLLFLGAAGPSRLLDRASKAIEFWESESTEYAISSVDPRVALETREEIFLESDPFFSEIDSTTVTLSFSIRQRKLPENIQSELNNLVPDIFKDISFEAPAILCDERSRKKFSKRNVTYEKLHNHNIGTPVFTSHGAYTPVLPKSDLRSPKEDNRKNIYIETIHHDQDSLMGTFNGPLVPVNCRSIKEGISAEDFKLSVTLNELTLDSIGFENYEFEPLEIEFTAMAIENFENTSSFEYYGSTIPGIGIVSWIPLERRFQTFHLSQRYCTESDENIAWQTCSANHDTHLIELQIPWDPTLRHRNKSLPFVTLWTKYGEKITDLFPANRFYQFSISDASLMDSKVYYLEVKIGASLEDVYPNKISISDLLWRDHLATDPRNIIDKGIDYEDLYNSAHRWIDAQGLTGVSTRSATEIIKVKSDQLSEQVSFMTLEIPANHIRLAIGACILATVFMFREHLRFLCKNTTNIRMQDTGSWIGTMQSRSASISVYITVCLLPPIATGILAAQFDNIKLLTWRGIVAGIIFSVTSIYCISIGLEYRKLRASLHDNVFEPY